MYVDVRSEFHGLIATFSHEGKRYKTFSIWRINSPWMWVWEMIRSLGVWDVLFDDESYLTLGSGAVVPCAPGWRGVSVEVKPEDPYFEAFNFVYGMTRRKLGL